jgi:hypothetical protein
MDVTAPGQEPGVSQSGTGGQQWRNPTKDMERDMMNKAIGAQTPKNP